MNHCFRLASILERHVLRHFHPSWWLRKSDGELERHRDAASSQILHSSSSSHASTSAWSSGIRLGISLVLFIHTTWTSSLPVCWLKSQPEVSRVSCLWLSSQLHHQHISTTRVAKKMKGVRKGVQLPEDILLEIVKLAPTVEDVLRLERVRRDY